MTIERIAETVWRKKQKAEQAEQEFRDTQAILIEEMQGAEVKTVIVVLDTDTDVTGTLVESERMVVSDVLEAELPRDVYERIFPVRVIPKQVIPESRSRVLDEDALRNAIADGSISASLARKHITYEASKKPFVKWTVKSTKLPTRGKKLAGLKNSAQKAPKVGRPR